MSQYTVILKSVWTYILWENSHKNIQIILWFAGNAKCFWKVACLYICNKSLIVLSNIQNLIHSMSYPDIVI